MTTLSPSTNPSLPSVLCFFLSLEWKGDQCVPSFPPFPLEETKAFRCESRVDPREEKRKGEAR